MAYRSYRTAQYSPPQRYLIKALREVAHQLEEVVADFSERELRWRPADGEWCAAELVGFLRDSEREDLQAVQAIVTRDGAPVEERRALHGPAEHDYRSAHVRDLLWDFAALRDELVWTLHDADAAWQHAGQHPFRGRVPLEQWVHEISDRDLEVMWKLSALREAVQARGAHR